MLLGKGSISKYVLRREGRQEAYFAIGELVAREGERGLRGKALAEALKRARTERAGGREGAAAETHHGPSGAYEAKRPALRAS